MTAYCRLCRLRIDVPGPPVDLSRSADEWARDELVGLGLAALHHIAKDHAGQLAGLFASLASIEALLACFCLEAPQTGVNDPPHVSRFFFERDRLKAEVIAWLSQAEPVQISPVEVLPCAHGRRSSNPLAMPEGSDPVDS